MITKTTTTQAPNTAQAIETVLEHSPIKVSDKAQQECWANFGLSFPTQNGRGYLQPGQFLPIWKRAGSRWQCKTEASLSIVSAFVLNGRYMIRGGDGKLSSHPEIQDWENGSPVKGQASELRFPGGVRRVTLGHVPMITANAGNYEGRALTARAFHDSFGLATLHEGCPIELVCRADQTTKELPRPWQRAMLDLVRNGEATLGYALPIPIISSNEEEVVLKDYPQNWTNALRDMLSYLGVTEVGVLYKTQGDEPVEGISSDRPQEVYRNALIKGDLGFSTLDPDLYERMLPLATGRFDAELMGV